jgi:hypothetical protein
VVFDEMSPRNRDLKACQKNNQGKSIFTLFVIEISAEEERTEG